MIVLDKFQFGDPKEHEAFVLRNARYFGDHKTLMAAIQATMIREDTENDDAIVLGLGRVLCEEFWDAIFLCASARGIGAFKILRSMYERAVTVRYLAAHPEKLKAFLRYASIQRAKVARAMKEAQPDLPKELLQKMDADLARAYAIKDQYTVSCKECGATRPSPSWGVDVVTMARDAGRPLCDLLGPCYYQANLHVHTTPDSLGAFLRQKSPGVLRFDGKRQPEQADRVLPFAHTILLDHLRLLAERFKGPGAEEAVQKAEQSYQHVWGRAISDPPPKEA